jgi:hypothetical protein
MYVPPTSGGPGADSRDGAVAELARRGGHVDDERERNRHGFDTLRRS